MLERKAYTTTPSHKRGFLKVLISRGKLLCNVLLIPLEFEFVLPFLTMTNDGVGDKVGVNAWLYKGEFCIYLYLATGYLGTPVTCNSCLEQRNKQGFSCWLPTSSHGAPENWVLGR